YVPFTTSDLYNWRYQNLPFSEKPQALTSLLESVFHTHQPTWDDCQQLLQTLFTLEERDRIFQETIRAALGPGGHTAPDHAQGIEAVLPTKCPNWDPNTNDALQEIQLEICHRIWATRGQQPFLPHQFKPGDLVLVCQHHSKTLEPHWKGSYPVILTTPSMLKVAGLTPWIHHTHAKLAPPEDNPPSTWKVLSQPEDQKIRLGWETKP
ncbi:Gag polyprotein, partial [Heterocephalus glaber]